MTLLEKINNLTWHNLINKLKDILKGLDAKPSGSEPTYKVYTALLNQQNENAPVATILENTLDNTPVFTYMTGGVYDIFLGENIDKNKVTIELGNIRGISQSEPQNNTRTYDLVDDNQNTGIYRMIVKRRPNNVTTFSLSNGQLQNNKIEIRVYN